MTVRSRIILGALILGIIGFITQFSYAQGQSLRTNQTPPPPQQQPTSILLENVRIFNGTSNQLSAVSNVLIVGNKIETICK